MTVPTELLESLRRYKGTPVTLEFTDGEFIDANILGIDAEDHEDFTYDVRRVRVSIPSTLYSKDAAYIAPLEMLKSVRPSAPDRRES